MDAGDADMVKRFEGKFLKVFGKLEEVYDYTRGLKAGIPKESPYYGDYYMRISHSDFGQMRCYTNDKLLAGKYQIGQYVTLMGKIKLFPNGIHNYPTSFLLVDCKE